VARRREWLVDLRVRRDPPRSLGEVVSNGLPMPRVPALRGADVSDSRGRVYQRKPGRVPLDPAHVRHIVVKVRVSPFERRAIERIARKNHETLTGFIREAIRDAIHECEDGGGF
jgi:hypothetical protein